MLPWVCLAQIKHFIPKVCFFLYLTTAHGDTAFCSGISSEILWLNLLEPYEPQMWSVQGPASSPPHCTCESCGPLPFLGATGPGVGKESVRTQSLLTKNTRFPRTGTFPKVGFINQVLKYLLLDYGLEF